MKFKLILILFTSFVLAACGSTPQPVVFLDKTALTNNPKKFGILYETPKSGATTNIYGAGCLLCYGVASALTSKLDNHLETNIGDTELETIKNLIKDIYQEQAVELKEVSLRRKISKLKKFKGGVGFAKKDFRPYKKMFGIDALVVVKVNGHGAYRGFNNYVPTTDPQGYVSIDIYTVDLSDNSYLQYLSIDEKVQPENVWDEPPTFPSVTTSYYQASEYAKNKIRNAFN